jgi:hypothetical protein
MSESRKKTVYGRKSVADEIDRRGNLRSQIVAGAEVIEANSGARFSTRISDVSGGGCFVDALNPLPIGSRVRLSLHGSSAVFETAGSVVYTQQGLGMGIAFDAMSPEQQSGFEEWLNGLGARSEMPAVMPSPAPGARQIPASDQDVLARLVHILISKGILTEADADALLRGPLL